MWAVGTSIFLDNASLWAGARTLARRKEKVSPQDELRIQYENLFKIAMQSSDMIIRTYDDVVCAGEIPLELERVFNPMREGKVGGKLYESGNEPGREERPGLYLYEHMLRNVELRARGSSYAVLITGDGIASHEGAGYSTVLEEMGNRGWGVEVMAWDFACDPRLRELAKALGAYIPLEDYYDSITFRPTLRPSSPLPLLRIQRARPSTA